MDGTLILTQIFNIKVFHMLSYNEFIEDETQLL